MKAIIASTLNRNCGVGQYTEQLARHLLPKLDDLKVLRKDDADKALFFNYPYRSFKSLQHYVAPYYLSKAIRKMEADIWHADLPAAYHSFELAGIKQPKVVSLHDAIPFYYQGSKIDFAVYKYQLSLAIKHAKAMIVVSESAKKDLIEKTGLDPRRIFAIPNGLPFQELSTHEKVNEKFTIRYLGGLGAPHKNVKLLLYAAKILEEKKLSFTMELGGYIPEKFFLKDIARELSLRSVKFVGFIPDQDKSRFLGSADLFAYPSLMEGFGFPPMEAMGCGTAVIASDIPVFRELLNTGAYLVQPTPEAFAKGIEQVMASKNLLEQYKNSGKEKVQKYTWEESAQKTREVYQLAAKSA